VGRVLAMQRTIVTPAERDRYLERARLSREHYASRQCRYWVFEDADLPGAFIEFAEAGDAAALTAALAGAPDRIVDPTRVYQEVAL
jgi:hypothetical protein